MNILLFSTSLRGGGAERIIQLLTRYLLAKGHQVTVISLDQGDPAYPFAEKVQLVHLKSGLLGRGPFKIFCLPVQALEFSRMVQKRRPDAVISFLVRANLVHVLSKIFGNQNRVILSHRNITQGLYGNAGLKDRVMLWLIKKLYPLGEDIICISEDVKASLVKLAIPAAKITVISNFIDGEIIAQTNPPGIQLPDDKPIIISMGRLIAQKDFATLLAAFAIVKETLDARLVIVGEGPLRARLVGLATRLGIATDVLFTGWLDNPFAALRQSKLFVLCSRYEGFGNVIVEAMACGLPVVCTNCPGGPSEILKDGRFGILTPVGDTHKLARKIVETLRNPILWQRLQQQSLSRVDDYRVEQLAPKYVEVITSTK